MNCFFRNQHEALFKATKPYQYVGGEFLSHNKNFDEAKVRFAFVFPDKYEIGISNLGVRIIYDRVNSYKRLANNLEQSEQSAQYIYPYLADRAYAPEPDFKPEFLYGVESKRALKDFDGVGFSLQYELSYPTVLKMLEMSGIGVRNSDRKEDEPIVFAGGPCTYNPLPLSDFIDVFCIGDGEEMMVEICEVLEQTKGKCRTERIKELCKIEGCWGVNGSSENFNLTDEEKIFQVRKRLAPLTNEYASTSYPIPFSSSVHDRAIVEIRRGCGRMCRFCQPGHVTLPIREREAEDIINITKELVNNTGYDEYSLLSLSSNDYKNINEVIKELAVDFNKRKISVSLPSQRIDGFNLELANLMQSVRKSTMTLAPEAGSQRLRNVIKKNISEEQIINAALTLYENGWSKLKFYFICGLPTETLEDMDEMAELLNKIKYRAKLIKREKGLNHGFEITCTLSIFVPKPFTPFQWCGQMDLDEVTAHIAYLKEKTKHIKGLKINYHEKFVSQIEAVLTRGDKKLSNYIYELYKKGCYLDAWGEHFDKNVWRETAEECGLSLEELAQHQFDLHLPLPWDFINVGLDKSWLQQEYCSAFEQTNIFTLQQTCEQGCVNCGVCKNLKTKKVLAKPYIASDEAQKILDVKPIDPTKVHPDNDRELFRYRLKVTKKGLLKYFSHLDWQNTFHKVLARTDLKIAYTLGFNPNMKVSLGVALPLFAESEGELIDIELLENTPCEEIKTSINKNLPDGAEIIDIKQIGRSEISIDNLAQWAEYKIIPYLKSDEDFDIAIDNFKKRVKEVLSLPEILITKKTKKKQDKVVDFKRSIGAYRFENDVLYIHLKVGQGSDVPALRADDLMKLVDEDKLYEITRIKFLDEKLHVL
ncbi:MAG: TIGR03960 family B12-binding radical SAM protein [Cyanobacteria bacterium SIG28]|nr:TIGR03960 family B12-binding radical SAM protein [Cyanobacteria bacterium SIG28]